MFHKSWHLLLLFLFPFCLFAESFVIQYNLTIEAGQNTYLLNHQNIVVNSENISSDEGLLLKNSHYFIDYQKGLLKLQKPLSSPYLTISYFIVPPELGAETKILSRHSLSDSLKPLKEIGSPNYFAQDSSLNLSGSKTFSLSFSDSRQADLLQSLYVNLDGELSKNIYLNARLSDSQSKLSPEGDSKELSSLDEIFIRIYGPKWELGMGDLDLRFEDSQYLKYLNKIEGIKYSYTNDDEFSLAYSAGSGKRASSQIRIIDGKQGPYYLGPDDYQRSFIIIAASEEIYLDGRLLERGTDYYIDYSEGSVMFRRMVSSQNSILCHYQYSDETYSQSSYFSSSSIRLSPSLKLFHHLIYQQDNKHHPLLFDFSDKDKASLKNAGDDIVYSDGVSQLEQGSGYYKLITTAEGLSYYEYAPGDTSAVYNIVFSYMGYGKGDYEEFSLGKYRWVGPSLGSWLPLKRLIAPAKRSNIELGLAYTGQSFDSGVEMLFSSLDKNTLSAIDDEDNYGGIVSAWLSNFESLSKFKYRLSGRHRFENSYFMGEQDRIEEDFLALPKADSLAMSDIEIAGRWEEDFWQPQLLFRIRHLNSFYTQKALRFYSYNTGKDFIPSLSLLSTLSKQDGNHQSLLQYYDLKAFWQYKLFKIGLNSLFSQMENTKPLSEGNRQFSFKPSFELKSLNSFSTLLYSLDESSIKGDIWQKQSRIETYSLKHNSNFGRQHINFDFSHREIQDFKSEDNPKKNYQLFSLNNSHSLLKGAFSLYGNYQLNQMEFYPRIRDLVYVGASFGTLDSTGVAVENGEYIYEYVTSNVGKLSSELSLVGGLYLKPGQYLKGNLWKRLSYDSFFSATQQLLKLLNWQSYVFLNSFASDDQIIYGNRSYNQNLGFDLYKGRILGSLSLEQGQSLDRRYQDEDEENKHIQSLQLDFKGFYSINSRLRLEYEELKQSRYQSLSRMYRASLNAERIFNPQSVLSIEAKAYREKGDSFDKDNAFTLDGLSLSPALRSVLRQKYRFSASFSIGYNDKKGSDYLSYLPNKREGLFGEGTLSTIYRINQYSNLSLEYRLGKYPKDKASHNLKIEFRAEL